MNKIRVLIIDDSLLIRKVLSEILNSSPDIEVVGTAEDPLIAREMIKELNPDVLTLDIEMPRMDGITFLRNLMRLRPMPVVMISALTESNAEVTLTALEIGAVDFIAKPNGDMADALNDYAEEIIAKVKVASQANIRRLE
ncbi:MAG: response regulator [Methylobacter sp.]